MLVRIQDKVYERKIEEYVTFTMPIIIESVERMNN